MYSSGVIERKGYAAARRRVNLVENVAPCLAGIGFVVFVVALGVGFLMGEPN
jgi:hypothetical protein